MLKFENGVIVDLTPEKENAIKETLKEHKKQELRRPLMLPINQEEVVTAIQHDTKLKKPLYEALGYNVDNLKKTIATVY